MKLLAKIFIWIGMALTFYLVFPVVVGILALKKLNEARSKEDIKTIGILTVLFCSILGGIFLLSIEDKDFSPIICKQINSVRQTKRIYTFNFYVVIMMLVLLLFSIAISLIFVFIYLGTWVEISLSFLSFFIILTMLLLAIGNIEKRKLTIRILALLSSVVSIVLVTVYPLTIGYLWGATWHELIIGARLPFIFSIIAFFLSIFILVCCSQKTEFFKLNVTNKKIESVMLSNLKVELDQLVAFYKEGIINENEYFKFRSLLIEKHTK